MTLMRRRSRSPSLFPYTTLFRSRVLIRLLHEDDKFVVLAAAGLVCQFGLQALINMAVNVQIAPSKGMTLPLDRKSTRLNSSHGYISYAVFCLKKKMHRDIAAYAA